MEYASLTGNRARQTVKTILLQCVANGDSYDAGNRYKMQRKRRRIMSQQDSDHAGKLLDHGTGTFWTTAYVNHNRIRKDGKKGVSRSTLIRTLKEKYDCQCHRRQTKATGTNKDKNGVWAQARLALAKQFQKQI